MELKNIITKLDSLKEELDGLCPIKDEYLRKFNQKLKLDWNYHSNSIEGNTLMLFSLKMREESYSYLYDYNLTEEEEEVSTLLKKKHKSILILFKNKWFFRQWKEHKLLF